MTNIQLTREELELIMNALSNQVNNYEKMLASDNLKEYSANTIQSIFDQLTICNSVLEKISKEGELQCLQ